MGVDLAGTPDAKENLGMLLVTILPNAIIEHAPIVTDFNIFTF